MLKLRFESPYGDLPVLAIGLFGTLYHDQSLRLSKVSMAHYSVFESYGRSLSQSLEMDFSRVGPPPNDQEVIHLGIGITHC